jgi:ribosomal protein S1
VENERKVLRGCVVGTRISRIKRSGVYIDIGRSKSYLCNESSLEYTSEAARDGDVRSVLILAQAMTSDGG